MSLGFFDGNFKTKKRSNLRNCSLIHTNTGAGKYVQFAFGWSRYPSINSETFQYEKDSFNQGQLQEAVLDF